MTALSPALSRSPPPKKALVPNPTATRPHLAGTHFVGRKPTGRVWKSSDPVEKKNLVLTRILWLDGEEDHNKTSKDRYIYIHGTNREDLIGTPASAGCVCLRNAEVIELYDLITVGTRIEIIA